jgi:hypothetical protein
MVMHKPSNADRIAALEHSLALLQTFVDSQTRAREGPDGVEIIHHSWHGHYRLARALAVNPVPKGAPLRARD